MFNRKTIESSTPAITKSNALGPKQQRARTASMPAENRKVSPFIALLSMEKQLFIYYQPVALPSNDESA